MPLILVHMSKSKGRLQSAVFYATVSPIICITSHRAEAGCLGEPEGHRLEHEEGSTLKDLS